MRSSLSSVRRRVEALSRHVLSCPHDHKRVRFDEVFEGEPLPEVPDAGRCACGQAFSWHRCVFRYLREGKA